MAKEGDTESARRGRRIALLIAGVGLSWLLATAVGAAFGLSPRVLALFDLAALAGFGFAIYLIYRMWRARRQDGD